MQEFTSAPKNTQAFKQLGYAYQVATMAVLIGTVIGIITEALPLYTITQANIGENLAGIIGTWANSVIFIGVIALIFYLAKENINAAKAVYNAWNNKESRKAHGGIALFILSFYFAFIVVARVGLTFIGSHQLADKAVIAPTLNFNTINQADSLQTEKQREITKSYEKQRQAVIADNKRVLNDAKKAAKASEAALQREMQSAANEYQKGQIKKRLDALRASNAEKLAVISAKGSEALITLNSAKLNAITVNDSLHNAQKALIVAADANAQNRHLWLSSKMRTYLPYISIASVLFVTLAAFLLCRVQLAAGIETEFQMGKYENMPSVLSVWAKAVQDIWQSWARWFAASLKRFAEIDLAKGGTIDAAAVGAGGTIELQQRQDVNKVTVSDSTINSTPLPPVNDAMPPPSIQPDANVNIITLPQATNNLNVHRNHLKNGTRKEATCHAWIQYYQHIISEMRAQNVSQLDVSRIPKPVIK